MQCCVVSAMAFASASGFAASAASGAPQRVPRPYDTSDPDLNAWADIHIDVYAQQKLASVDPELRTKALFITRQKSVNGNCNNPSQYVQGIIRKEVNGPYSGPSGSWPPQSTPQLRPPTLLPSQVQAVPTPMQAPAPAPVATLPVVSQPQAVPHWVTAAVALHMNRSALFRAVAACIPADAMATLSKLPSSFQTACVLSMLVSSDHYSKPEQYISWFVQRSLAMNPPQCGSVSTSAASSCGGSDAKKLVAIFLGNISGAEWLGVALALQSFSEEKRSFEILERVHVAPTSRWQPVLDEVSQRLSPTAPFTTISPPEAAQALAAKAPLWSAHGATVLCICFGPTPQRTPTWGNATLPSYHGSTSSDL